MFSLLSLSLFSFSLPSIKDQNIDSLFKASLSLFHFSFSFLDLQRKHRSDRTKSSVESNRERTVLLMLVS